MVGQKKRGSWAKREKQRMEEDDHFSRTSPSTSALGDRPECNMDHSSVNHESECSDDRLKNNFHEGIMSTSKQVDNILEPEVKISGLMEKHDVGYCDECKINFFMLKLHQAVCHRNKEEKRCTICGQPFLKRSKLINHLLKHENNIIKCHYCSKQDFEGFEDLFEHLEEHVSLHIYICYICNQSFAMKDKLDDHLNAHLSSWKLPFLECFKCGMRFEPQKRGIRMLKKHWALLHSNNFTCDQCSKKFKKFIVFFNHCLRHLNLLPYVCDQCGLGFRKECRLKEHFNSVHCDKVNYKCDKCEMEFKYKTSFDAHVRFHDDSLCFTCHHCSKLFLRKVSLLDHFLEKSCSLCDEEFHCRTTFDKHFRTFHSTDKAFKCDECSKSYVLENSLKRHKTLEHPKRNENIFRCSLCIYETSTLHNLNRHKRRNHSSK